MSIFHRNQRPIHIWLFWLTFATLHAKLWGYWYLKVHSYILVASVTENRSIKPNTNQHRGKIPKPNKLKNMREIQTCYQSHSLLNISKDDNTNKIPKTLWLKYQMPSWYQFGIGVPKSLYPIDIFNTYLSRTLYVCLFGGRSSISGYSLRHNPAEARASWFSQSQPCSLTFKPADWRSAAPAAPLSSGG